MTNRGTLHVLHSLRAEGCPRLALALLQEEQRQFGRTGTIAVAVETPDDLAPECAALGVDVAHLGWRPRGFLDLARQTSGLLRTLRPRGIVCYTVGLHVPVALAARRNGIANVLHIGNAPPAHPRVRRVIQAQMQVGRPFVTRYAACSEYVRREAIAAYRLPASAVAAVPNGIPLRRFEAVRRLRSRRPPARPRVVGMIASFEGHKNQRTLIEAVARIRARGGEVSLRLVGAGSREGDLRALAARLGVGQHIAWGGVVVDVATALADLDVFAYAVTREEGLGIALVEALAAGVPIVASDVGACREVLGDGRFGRLVDATKADAWADALMDPDLDAAPAGAAARYDIARTLAAYDGLLRRM